MYREPEFDMSPEEIYGEGPKTWAFHHYGWSAAAIAEMKATGEWYEDKDAPEEYDEDEEPDDEDEEEEE